MQDRRAVHYLARRRFAGRRCLHHDLHFVFKIRITDLHVHHKAIELGFGKRVGAFLLDGVLRGQNEKRQVERKSGAARCDFVFLHRLQECRLGLGRCPVDFVREQDVGENRPAEKLKSAPAGGGIFLQDIGAGDVRRH